MIGSMAGWPVRRWWAAAAGAVLTGLLTGVPTGIVPSSLYTRMTPVLWWNYPVWAAVSVLSGLVWATYVHSPTSSPRSTPLGVGGGILSVLAVGCPVCNKVVVLAVGVTGALDLWAPLQPVLGVASVLLLGWALRQRLKGERSCPFPSLQAMTPAP